MFANLGVAVIDADEVGRRLMQPGQPVYDSIVEHFGREVVRADGSLNRQGLAELAFSHGRLEELNRLVHPPVIAAQEAWLRGVFADDPHAIAMIESALIFEASGNDSKAGSAPGWGERFDRIVLVTVSDELKVLRYVDRALQQPVKPSAATGDRESLAAEARKRLAAQIPDREKIGLCHWVIDNSGDIDATAEAVRRVYSELKAAAAKL